MPTNKKKSAKTKSTMEDLLKRVGRVPPKTTPAAAADPAPTPTLVKADQRLDHILITEPPIAPSGSVISSIGLENIARHEYQPGDYTYLDELLNPVWTNLVELLPPTMAPNLVTTLGGAFCLVSFLLSSYFLSLDDQDSIPSWLYLFNGLALAAYYTLDCMDGKQARRTQSSSPLGQLFDHGMDGLCNLSHVQSMQCIFQLPSSLILILQCSLQSAFFQAQWEEYYTGKLPHSSGKFCGVTEATYGMAMWSLVTFVMGRDMYDTIVWTIPDQMMNDYYLSDWLTGTANNQLQVRHVAALAWVSMILVLMASSFVRVWNHVKSVTVFLAGVEKLVLGPYLLTLVALVVNMNQVGQPSAFALGLAYCHITIKIIVFGMAKMAYASWQVDILFPYIFLSIWLRVSPENETNPDPTHWKWVRGLDAFYLLAIAVWIRTAIRQLCTKLDVDLFRIKGVGAGSVSSPRAAAAGPKDIATAVSSETVATTGTTDDSLVVENKKDD